MDFLFSIFDKSFFAELLSAQAKASLTEKIIIITVVWWVMGRKVRDHFSALQASVSALQIEIRDGLHKISESLGEVESSHRKRMDNLEGRIEKVEKK